MGPLISPSAAGNWYTEQGNDLQPGHQGFMLIQIAAEWQQLSDSFQGFRVFSVKSLSSKTPRWFAQHRQSEADHRHVGGSKFSGRFFANRPGVFHRTWSTRHRKRAHMVSAISVCGGCWRAVIGLYSCLLQQSAFPLDVEKKGAGVLSCQTDKSQQYPWR